MLRERPLIEYLPLVLRGVREHQALAAGEEPEITLLWKEVNAALADQFVLSATENGVKRWEKILRITPKATFTLNERKFTILARLAEQLPYSYRMLERMLSQLCGPDGFKLNVSEYTVSVKVALTAKRNYDDVGTMLRRVCPANMVIEVSILYNTHYVLSHFTHAQLSKYRYNDLRNEVIT